MKLTVREIAIFGVLSAMMYASKLAMDFLPNIHLIGVFVIALTVVYRKKALYPIYAFVFISGLFSAFSAWWLPYLYIWLVLWCWVMVLPKDINPKIKPLVYMCICSLHGFLYGILYAPVQMLVFGLSFKAIIAWIIVGLPWDLLHGAGNFFCAVLVCPIIKALKYGEKYSR